MVAVPQGITPAGLNSKPVFPVKASTRETVSFVLKMRNEATLERKVGNGIYSHFLTVGQFARGYGQTAARISALEKYLKRFHLKTRAYADRLDVTATGTAGGFNHALAVSQSVYRSAAVPASAGHAAQPAVTFTASSDAPKLPRSIASYVEAVLGLDNYPVNASNAMHVPVVRPGKAARAAATTGQSLADPLGALKPQDFESEYGLSSAESQAQGQGQTLGIITFAAMHPADAAKFWSAVGIATKPNRITLANVDGGARFGARFDSQESTLDVEQSGGVAPQANIIVYQAPNSDFGTIDAYAAAASQDKAGTVSCSWGESETVLAAFGRAGKESPALVKANDEFFLELAAQGQSSFTASGDAGAYAASNDLHTKNLSVQSASDSPWTTAAGATTLPGTLGLTDTVSVPIKAERAWGWDWQWPFWKQLGYPNEASAATHNVVGSTGGYSAVEARPAYQSKVAKHQHLPRGSLPQADRLPAGAADQPEGAGGLAGLDRRGQGQGGAEAGQGSEPEGPGRARPVGERRPVHRLRALLRRHPGRLGRDELRRAAAERRYRRDRLNPEAPYRLLEPGNLPARPVGALAVHPAGRHRVG